MNTNDERRDRLAKQADELVSKMKAEAETIAPVVVGASEIETKPLKWLWPGRLPLGKLALLDGDPGLGKSLVTLDIAARVSRGDVMPDGSRGDVEGPAGVLLVSVEDDPADTIVPRLNAAEADTTQIKLLMGLREATVGPKGKRTTKRRPLSLRDVECLREAMAQVNARLVIIDPLMAFLPGDANKDQDVRQILSPLAELAAETGATILLVRHLNKAGHGTALYRGGGSIGIIGAVRSALLVAKDPEDSIGNRRVLAVTKCNLAPTSGTSLAFDVKVCSSLLTVQWAGYCQHSADDLLSTTPEDSEGQGKLSEAVEWLRNLLAKGPVEASVGTAKARADGISQRTLERARRKLGVECSSAGFGLAWRWILPEAGEPPDPLAPVAPEMPESARKAVEMIQGVFGECTVDSFRDLKKEASSAHD